MIFVDCRNPNGDTRGFNAETYHHPSRRCCEMRIRTYKEIRAKFKLIEGGSSFRCEMHIRTCKIEEIHTKFKFF